MIEVKDLTKQYGSYRAVNAISFEAGPGQVTGFLGPNGAGKTTTMRMLTGFLPPTSGHALVAGKDAFDESMEVRKAVGYLPENVPLYRDMTALGYLMYMAEIRGVPNRKARAMETLERVRLADRATSKIRTLSKGMRQRVGLAQALIHDPQVLILDEPTIGLDPIQVLELRELVRELGKKHTVLFSTHILSEAEQVCDRVIIINRGKIVAQGTPATLRAQLQSGSHLYVQVGGAQSDAALKLLRGIPGVNDVQPNGTGYSVRAGAKHDVRAEVSGRVANAGYSLLEMRPVAMTLEDIFLDIVGREDKP
jgi:ABC-2 type transport system ATP-binding protein